MYDSSLEIKTMKSKSFCLNSNDPQVIAKPNIELEHLKDEDYLIQKAKSELTHDVFSAKSWLLTAQTIYPQNFRILFEIYKISKQEKNISETSNFLGTMFQNFRHEPSLWIEIDHIMELLCDIASSSLNISQAPFLAQIFYSMHKDIQKEMIIFASEKSKNTMEYCSIMLLLTSTFPESTAYNGLKLVDALMKAEKPNQGPLNPYRRKLVCELLPRLLQAEGLEVRPKTLHHLLTKSVEFYVAYATTPAKIAQTSLEGESIIEDPWHELFSVVRLIGWNLGWELATEFDIVSNREVILQRIQSMVEGGARLGSPKDNGEDVREVLFTTVTVFLHALLDYTHRLYPDFTQGDSSSTFPPPLTLVEAFTKAEREEKTYSPKPLLSPSSKRLRPSLEEEQSTAFITVSILSQSGASGGSTELLSAAGSASNNPLNLVNSLQPNLSSSGALSQSLITAIKCWDLLHAYEQLRSEFVRVLEGLSVERWLIIFNMDILIYEGRLAEAERQLRHALIRARQSPPTSNSLITILTLNLKLASVLFALNKFSVGAESALDIVEQLAALSSLGGLTNNLVVPTTPNKRHLHLLALTRPQCLQFVTTLLIHSLRHLIVIEGNREDLAIGHLLILLQYEWPRHENIFEEIVFIIKKKGRFAYQHFAPYVTTPDILEEFMFLSTTLGGGFLLDILPLPHSSKQQRMSTRGADRGSKQDFKFAINKQMLRCHESVETNIVSFLKLQGHIIPHVFMFS